VKRLKSRDGFTVMEVMIALVILSIGLLGLVTTAALVTRMIGRGHRATQAALLAQEKLEELRARLGATRNCANPPPLSGSETVGPNGTYTRTWRITPNAFERRIDLFITYPAGPEQMRTDRLNTVVSCAP
jgi:prepilin-type N-terminal cleavage/methylation domain-containing protein